ncbi:MAG TPA: CHAT domain-containing protein, partial [Albitalea sp.]
AREGMLGASPPAKRAVPPRMAPAPAAGAGSVACHFRAETDDEYVLDKVHTVTVTIAREQLEATGRGASARGSAKVKAAKPLVVECMPMLRVALKDPDDARVEIPVPPAGEPAELCFDLVGREAGPAEVRVQVRQGPLPLVTLSLTLAVVEARSGTRRPVQASADLAEFPGIPRATDELRIVQMRPTGGTTQYRYELRLPSVRVQKAFESDVLDSEPGAYVAAIHKRIEDRWTEHQSERKAFARDLRAIGADLFDNLFPLELRQLLWKYRKRIGSVQVLSSEPFIPWELVHLRDPNERTAGADSAFLGELGVVRWLVSGYPPETLRLRKGKARYVVPAYDGVDALPEAQREVELVEKRFGATEVAPEAEAIYSLLESPGQFDLLHVACHGVADAADIGSARLEMPGKPRSDGSSSEEHVLATTVQREAQLRDGDAQPIVVLNACQSARAGYALKGLGGFAQAFVEGGAGVFVGSSWSVGDAPALAFIEEFYARLTDKKKPEPLARAAAAARIKARDDGDATWLAYVVYGHPMAKVKAA